MFDHLSGLGFADGTVRWTLAVQLPGDRLIKVPVEALQIPQCDCEPFVANVRTQFGKRTSGRRGPSYPCNCGGSL